MSSEPGGRRRARVPRRHRELILRLRDRAQRSMMLTLPSQEPRDYLYDLLPNYPLRQGKGLRPALCMASCAAFGGSYREAVPFAAALELLHNAFLIHDDIQDGSAVRRGRHALHKEHGLPLALNAGNALAAAANAVFLDALRPLRPAVADALIESWEHMMMATLEGQSLDLGWQRDNVLEISMEHYFEMCAKKTAWYTAIQPLAIGATLGSGDPDVDRDVFRFGWLLGVLFQLANDLDGLDTSSGKSDVAEGKRTALLIHLVGQVNEDERHEISRIMGLDQSGRTESDIDQVHRLMQDRGSVEYTRAALLDLADAADAAAKDTFGWLPPSDDRDLLLLATSYVLEETGGIGRAGAGSAARASRRPRLPTAPPTRRSGPGRPYGAPSPAPR
jgi:geranylgeranyl diphosphate synthase type II